MRARAHEGGIVEKSAAFREALIAASVKTLAALTELRPPVRRGAVTRLAAAPA